jgi:hypothetical protein
MGCSRVFGAAVLGQQLLTASFSALQGHHSCTTAETYGESPYTREKEACAERHRRMPDGRFYSTIASVGQTDVQVPHPVQISCLISNLPSPSLMASTGHSSAQVPQETQSSVILYAMTISLLK